MSFKIAKNKSTLRPVHLQVLVFIILYFVFSNLITARILYIPNIYVSFAGSFAFGLMTSSIFLFLFSHEDFFRFFGKLERIEKKKEASYLDRFGNYGKIIASILIGTIGGSIFLALTVRILFSTPKEQRRVVFVSVLISTLILFGFGKGIISIMN